MCLAWIRTFDHVFVETTGTVPTRPFYAMIKVVGDLTPTCPSGSMADVWPDVGKRVAKFYLEKSNF